MCDETCCCCLSIGTCYCNDGNTGTASRRIKHVYHRFCNISRKTFGGGDMHSESRTGINFKNGTSIFIEGYANIRRHYINAANIESDNSCNSFGHKNIEWMNNFCYIRRSSSGTKICRSLQVQIFILLKNTF